MKWSLIAIAACGSDVGKSEHGSDGAMGQQLSTQFATAPSQWFLPDGGKLNGGFFALSAAPFVAVGDQHWTLTDMTGDGRPDLVVYAVVRQVDGTENQDDIYIEPFDYLNGTPHWKVFENQGSSFSQTATSWALPQGGKVNRGFNKPTYTESNNFDWHQKIMDQSWTLMDMDGDARPDLVVSGVAVELPQLGYVFQVLDKATNPHWNVYKNNGAGFDASPIAWELPPTTAQQFGGLWSWQSAINRVAGEEHWDTRDMNGDHKPDLVVYGVTSMIEGAIQSQPYGHPQAPVWQVYLNNGAGFATEPASWQLPIQRGDHRLGLFAAGGGGQADGDEHWTLLDLTGDEKPELVFTAQVAASAPKAFGYPSTSSWQVHTNNGAGFDAVQTWMLPAGGTSQGGFLSVSGYGSTVLGDDVWNTRDLDSDGLPDLIAFGEFASAASDSGVYTFGRLGGTAHWKLFHNTGSGFASVESQWAVPNPGGNTITGFPGDSGSAVKVGDQSWAVLDMNGDDRDDLVIYNDAIAQDGAGLDLRPAGYQAEPYWRVLLGQP